MLIVHCVERRKIERRIRRLEKQLRVSAGPVQDADISEQLSKLKDDLEYVRVSLYTVLSYIVVNCKCSEEIVMKLLVILTYVK